MPMSYLGWFESTLNSLNLKPGMQLRLLPKRSANGSTAAFPEPLGSRMNEKKLYNLVAIGTGKP